METIDEYMRSYLGERKVPLAYVVRKNVAIPDGDDPSTNYPTIQDEMIARAPHTVVATDGTVTPDPIYLVIAKRSGTLSRRSPETTPPGRM